MRWENDSQTHTTEKDNTYNMRKKQQREGQRTVMDIQHEEEQTTEGQ